MPGVFPDYPAPVIRNTGTGTELAMMRWGMPPPLRTAATFDRRLTPTDAERGRLRHVAADLLALLPQVGGILLMVGRLPNSGIKVFASPL
jgi:hypothetical protein